MRILIPVLFCTMMCSGCISMPTGIHPWTGGSTAKTSSPTAIPAPPRPVKADDITETNLHEKIDQFEKELKHDEKDSD